MIVVFVVVVAAEVVSARPSVLNLRLRTVVAPRVDAEPSTDVVVRFVHHALV